MLRRTQYASDKILDQLGQDDVGTAVKPTDTQYIVLCDTPADRVRVHEAARALGLQSKGFTSAHPAAKEVWYCHCTECDEWSNLSSWDYESGLGLAEAAHELGIIGDAEYTSMRQARSREWCETMEDMTCCPKCASFCDRFTNDGDEDCPCVKGRATCTEHASIRRGHNAVFVCAGPLPVKRGWYYRRRRNAHLKKQ